MSCMHLIAGAIVTNAAGFAVAQGTVAGVPWTLLGVSAPQPSGQTFVSANPVLFTPISGSVIGAITVTGLDRNGETIVEVIPAATANGAVAFSTAALFNSITSITAAGSSVGATIVLTEVQTGSPALYLGTIAGFAALVGQTVTISGFLNAANNGTFVVTAATAAHIGVVNASAVAEVYPVVFGTVTGVTANTPTAGKADYAGTFTGGAAGAFNGSFITITGFANNLNNGTYQIITSTATDIVVANGNAITELDPLVLAATAVVAAGGINTYTGTFTGGAAGAFNGSTVVISGMATPANNGTFVVLTSTATIITVTKVGGSTEAGQTASFTWTPSITSGTIPHVVVGSGFTISAGWGAINYSPWLQAGYRRASVSAIVLGAGNYNVQVTDQNFLDPYANTGWEPNANSGLLAPQAPYQQGPTLWPLLFHSVNSPGYEDDGTYSGGTLASNALSLAAPGTTALTVGFVTPTPSEHFAYRIITTTAKVQLDVNVKR
jgi:hypothetical protein